MNADLQAVNNGLRVEIADLRAQVGRLRSSRSNRIHQNRIRRQQDQALRRSHELLLSLHAKINQHQAQHGNAPTTWRKLRMAYSIARGHRRFSRFIPPVKDSVVTMFALDCYQLFYAECTPAQVMHLHNLRHV